MSRCQTKRAMATLAILAILGLGIVFVFVLYGGATVVDTATAYREGDWQAVETAARSALTKNPQDIETLRLLARALSRQERDERAEAIYRRIGAERMDAEDLALLGRGLLRRGLEGPGLAALGAARDLDPDQPEALEALAQLWSRKGSDLEAVEAATRLTTRPGWELRGKAILGPLQFSIGEPEAAAATLDQVITSSRDLSGTGLDLTRARKLLARAWLSAGHPEKASAAIRALPKSVQDGETTWLAARSELQRGHIPTQPAAQTDDPLRREPAPYVGASRCRECHPNEFERQRASRHARTFSGRTDLLALPWPESPIADSDATNVSHEFRRDLDQIRVKTRVGAREFDALLAYVLGSNHQGQSFLARDPQGKWRELRISRYPVEPCWSRTNEHPEVPPDEEGYLGRPVSEFAARRCLQCHSTTFQGAEQGSKRLEGVDRGIACERCHGPAGNHLRAVAAKLDDLAIARPRLARPADSQTICAECHKPPGPSQSDDPRSIRFQVPSLTRSRCFNESDGALGCVTCHDPHQDARHDALFYEAKCLSCHNGQNSKKVICRVNPTSDCLNCHMPRVTDAVPRSVFTDHHIRIRQSAGVP